MSIKYNVAKFDNISDVLSGIEHWNEAADMEEIRNTENTGLLYSINKNRIEKYRRIVSLLSYRLKRLTNEL